jgi:hypothetical protein
MAYICTKFHEKLSAWLSGDDGNKLPYIHTRTRTHHDLRSELFSSQKNSDLKSDVVQ